MATKIHSEALQQRLAPKAGKPQTSTNPGHSAPKARQEPANDPFDIAPTNIFYILFACHILAALFHPIQDCDEVFNYWEPTHYLNHGYGFQTWEYSPDYAIRSWAYTGLHALIIAPLHNMEAGKIPEFYLLRIVLGLVCALCETRLFTKISATLNSRIAIMFALIMATSPGMFHASVAYLPSSFAMYFVMLGTAAFMDWRGGIHTAQGIFMFGTGALLGWPFAAAMAAPFLLEELYLSVLSDAESRTALFWRVIGGTCLTLLVLGIQVAVDCFFYKKAVLVPLNIVIYNVFGGKGPDLYGTEPWHFYLRNLFLNFHVWLLLALLSLPLLLAQHFFRTKGSTKSSYFRGVVFLAPFYLWLFIFTLQPHKEERFMYPAYPALALNAAVALHIILANLGSTDANDIVAKIPVTIRLLGILGFILFALALSLFRTVGQISAYDAPMAIYNKLHGNNATRPGDLLCLGKEWYRFPSHYILPHGVKAKFIKSEFSGLLPGEFSEVPSESSFDRFAGASIVPSGMNDENREDLSKYTEIKLCTFLVDSRLPSTRPTSLEPSYIADDSTWERLQCIPFLDAISTHPLARMLWIPDHSYIPSRFKRVWGEYCLLKRKPRKIAREERAARLDIPNIETLG